EILRRRTADLDAAEHALLAAEPAAEEVADPQQVELVERGANLGLVTAAEGDECVLECLRVGAQLPEGLGRPGQVGDDAADLAVRRAHNASPLLAVPESVSAVSAPVVTGASRRRHGVAGWKSPLAISAVASPGWTRCTGSARVNT